MTTTPQLTGLQRAIAAHVAETAGQPDYIADVRGLAASLPGGVVHRPRWFSAAAPQTTTPPDKMKILNWGVNDLPGGKVVIDDDVLRDFYTNQPGRVMVDYENGTVEGSPEFVRTEGERRIAGSGAPMLYADDGLYLEQLSWNDPGADAAANYDALKPAVTVDGDDRLKTLVSVGLSRSSGVYLVTDSAPEAAPSSYSAPRPARRPSALNPTLAQLRAIGQAKGLNLAMAAHARENANDPAYARPGDRPRAYSALANNIRALNPNLKGLDLSIAIHNAEHAGEKYYK